MRKFYGIYFALFFFIVACNKWDKPEQVPAYLQIDEIDLNVTPTQGTAAHGIVDAWVYVNDQAVGVFELPCTVPVLGEGYQKITISAGIKNDGLNESRTKYPLFQDYITSSVNLVPGQVIHMTGTNQPVVTYYPSSGPDAVIEIWNENFDDAAIDFIAHSNSEAGVVHVTDASKVFEGNGCGKIELDSSLNFARVLTAQTFMLPKGGKPVYVELHYNTNNSMGVGIQALTTSGESNLDNTILKPTNGVWKKIYVKLTDLVSQQANATQFKFILTVNKDSEVESVVNYFDNFKVVYDK